MFLDGVGLGVDDADVNPLAAPWPGLEALAGRRWTAPSWGAEEGGSGVGVAGIVARSLDAALEHAGVPQSATGQTSLLTGLNAARTMGGHYGPWPGPTLRALLDHGTLFHDGVAAGGAALANVYPPGYFAALSGRRLRRSAPVHAALAAGLELATVETYERGEAVSADLDGAFMRVGERPRGAPSALATTPFDPVGIVGEAERLARLARRHSFTFFDVWLTDQIGHRADAGAASAVLARLDAFMAALSSALDDDVTLLVTSDHGNLEDVRTPRHSRASVPLIARGPGAAEFARATSLLDVAGGVRRVLAGVGAATT